MELLMCTKEQALLMAVEDWNSRAKTRRDKIVCSCIEKRNGAFYIHFKNRGQKGFLCFVLTSRTYKKFFGSVFCLNDVQGFKSYKGAVKAVESFNKTSTDYFIDLSDDIVEIKCFEGSVYLPPCLDTSTSRAFWNYVKYRVPEKNLMEGVERNEKRNTYHL